MMERKKNKGFTLVELLLVITIMIILAILAIGAINPIAQVNKGNDAKRKKDMGRIKIAMEDYYNDKGCYPGQTKINELINPANCSKGVFAPWLPTWPCDSRNETYKLAVKPGLCPKWFKVFTKLDNKKDAGIPQGWVTGTGYVGSFANTYSHSQVNYGMSSTNVRWDDQAAPGSCGPGCMVDAGGGTCNGAPGPGGSCVDANNCYIGKCIPECKVSHCDDEGYY